MKKHITLALLVLGSTLSFAQQDSLNTQLMGHLSYNPNLNDVWGYADTATGNEYALVGVRNGFSVVNVTNPANPVEEFFIPGASSTWRDIKTWDHYAYVMHDFSNSMSGNNGLLIVDLDSIDNPFYKFMYPSATLNGVEDSATRSHNLWVDENGVLYIFGADVGFGGALMYDVATDPMNPVFLGLYNSSYLHDGYARGDTLWGAALQNGLVVSDVSNKAQPQFLSQFNTPSVFAHNCWLSDDGNTLFTTDEVSAGYVAAYDVSDLSNVSETDRFRVQPNNNTIPHNAHVHGDFLVTSYYTYGLQVMDITVPDWLIEVAFYDTSPLSGDGYDGAWGAYPYLPSGVNLITDIQEGLFVLNTNYVHAARNYGVVKDSLTGVLLPAAKVYLKQDNDSVQLDPFNADFRRHKIGSFSDSIFVTATGYRSLALPFEYVSGPGVDTIELKMLPIDFSVNEENPLGLQMSPNPASNFVTLRSEATFKDANIQLMDMTGRVIAEKSWLSGAKEVRLDLDVPSGVYLVRVNEGANSWTERLVVK